MAETRPQRLSPWAAKAASLAILFLVLAALCLIDAWHRPFVDELSESN